MLSVRYTISCYAPVLLSTSSFEKIGLGELGNVPGYRASEQQNQHLNIGIPDLTYFRLPSTPVNTSTGVGKSRFTVVCRENTITNK